MFGANLVIPAQICEEFSCGQCKVHGETDGRTDGQTDRRWQRQYPFGLKGQMIKTQHSRCLSHIKIQSPHHQFNIPYFHLSRLVAPNPHKQNYNPTHTNQQYWCKADSNSLTSPPRGSTLKTQSPHQQSYNRIPMYHHSRYRAHTNSLTMAFLCITTQDIEPTPTVLQSYSYVSPL